MPDKVRLNLLRELASHHNGERFGQHFFSMTDYCLRMDGVPAYLDDPLSDEAVRARKLALYMVIGFMEARRDAEGKSRPMREVWASLKRNQRTQVDGVTLMLLAPEVPCGADGYDIYRSTYEGMKCGMQPIPHIEAVFLTYITRNVGCDTAAEVFRLLHPEPFIQCCDECGEPAFDDSNLCGACLYPYTITIREGGYYLTRKGKVRGPMRPLPMTGFSGYMWTDAAEGEAIYGNVWTDEGFYLIGEPEPDDLDLVSECSP